LWLKRGIKQVREQFERELPLVHRKHRESKAGGDRGIRRKESARSSFALAQEGNVHRAEDTGRCRANGAFFVPAVSPGFVVVRSSLGSPNPTVGHATLAALLGFSEALSPWPELQVARIKASK